MEDPHPKMITLSTLEMTVTFSNYAAETIKNPLQTCLDIAQITPSKDNPWLKVKSYYTLLY